MRVPSSGGCGWCVHVFQLQVFCKTWKQTAHSCCRMDQLATREDEPYGVKVHGRRRGCQCRPRTGWGRRVCWAGGNGGWQ